MVHKEKQSAETLSPGAHLAQILAERRMKQAELAALMGRPPQYVHDVVKRKKGMDARVAMELEEALLEPSASQWLEWELEYQRFMLRQNEAGKKDASVKRRDVMDEYPFAVDAVRRGWIPDDRDPSVLKQHVLSFLNDQPTSVAFKYSPKMDAYENSLKAWTIQLSRELSQKSARALKLSQERFESLLNELRPLMAVEEGVEQVEGILERYGIRFIVLASLKKAPVDGAASWNAGKPFIAITLRHGQIDRFWFVLMHELAHIYARDKATELVLDNYDERGTYDEKEALADARATEWILPKVELQAFIASGDFSLEGIRLFAVARQLHPAIVIGRLKSEGWLPWHAFAREHVSIRDNLNRALKAAD